MEEGLPSQTRRRSRSLITQQQLAISRHALNSRRLFVLLGIVVATALWAVSNIKNSSRIDGPQGRGYSASRAGAAFCFAPATSGRLAALCQSVAPDNCHAPYAGSG